MEATYVVRMIYEPVLFYIQSYDKKQIYLQIILNLIYHSPTKGFVFDSFERVKELDYVYETVIIQVRITKIKL